MAKKIQAPEKELRFTRSGQATAFWIVAAVLVAASITMLATSIYRGVNPELPHPLWAILPLLLAWLAARTAWKLTKHAYVIFTPLGVEIFPFFKPEQTMRLVLWQEIQDAEVNPELTRLTLHHDLEKTSGVHISLRPIRKDRRALLAKAITGRVSRV
jgi:hypothetical protein